MQNNKTYTGYAADSDGFSIYRVAELASYYRPFCAKQLMVYGIVSLIVAILTLLPMGDIAKVAIFTISWAAIPLLYYLAPIVLAKSGDSRIVERMIPVRASEKFIFYLLYFGVAVPIAVYMLPFISNILYLHLPSIQTKAMTGLVEIQMHNPAVIVVLNSLTALAISLTCLYVILSAKTARIVKAVISAFAVQFGIGLVSAIMGGLMEFKEGLKAGYNAEISSKAVELTSRTPHGATYADGVSAGMDAGFEFANAIVTEMIDDHATIITLYSVVGIYLLLMICLTYRNLKRANL